MPSLGQYSRRLDRWMQYSTLYKCTVLFIDVSVCSVRLFTLVLHWSIKCWHWQWHAKHALQLIRMYALRCCCSCCHCCKMRASWE